MSSSANSLSIAVIGAGPGGLAFARAAQLSGHKVHVFERSSELKTRGGSLQLTQGARCISEHLGLGQQLEAIGNDQSAFAMILQGEKEPMVRQLSDNDKRRRVMRMELVSMLTASLEPGTVLFNKELESVSAADETGPVTCRFKDGTSSSHDLVVGADGINSCVRRQLFDTPPKQFAGFRMHVLLDKNGHRQKKGFSVGVPALHLVPDQNAYLLEIGCMCADGSCCDSIYLVFKTDEEVTDAWDHTVAKEGFRKKLAPFANVEDDYLFDLLESAETAWDWGVYQHAPVASWSALGGRVCLLGDSCHATAPFLGQGANMAIQDAVCLARCLSTMTVPQATKAYEERRKPSCEKIVESSKGMAEAIIAAGATQEAADKLLATFTTFQEAELVV